MSENVNLIQVLGFGPGGSAIGKAFDEINQFSHVVEHDGFVVVHNDVNTIGSGGLNVNIRSNSPAIEFLHPINHNGIFEHDLTSPEITNLESYGSNPAHLGLVVAPALHKLGVTLAHGVETGVGGFISATAAYVIYDEKNKTYSSFNSSGHELAQSSNIVLSTGAQEELLENLYELPGIVLSSHDVLSGLKISNIEETIASGHPIHIVGGSHGAFSAADLILKTFPNIRENGIKIIAKDSPKIFYNTVAEAIQDGYAFSEDNVCQQTGRVNRFGGIRGDAKELYRAINQGTETRANIELYQQDLRNHPGLKKAPLIVQATGYKARSIPIYNTAGQLIGPYKEKGQVAVDNGCKIYATEGNERYILEGAYWNGSGGGILPSPEIGGEKSYTGRLEGVNLSNYLAGLIIKNILSR